MSEKYRDLPRRWKAAVVILALIVGCLGASLLGFQHFLRTYRASCAQKRLEAEKPDSELLGTRIAIERDGKAPVSANIYIPEGLPEDERLPVVVNIHGGGFVAGDADALDTQSLRLCQQWHAIILSVNYTTADVKPISYGAEEIADAVRYLADNADACHADASKVSLVGYSAGAFYAAEAAMKLESSGFEPHGLVLCYPWTRGLPSRHLSERLPRTLFVLAGLDPISQNAKGYVQSVRDAGVDLSVVEYADARHSFIESNNPEGEHDAAALAEGVVSPEQEMLARKAETAIGTWLGLE